MSKNLPFLRTLSGLCGLGLLCGLALPTAGVAAEPASTHSAQPVNDSCAEAVEIDIDVVNGNVYLIDSAGNPTLVQGPIDVYMGGEESLMVYLDYSASEWDVESIPSGGTSVMYQTTGGLVRVPVDSQVTEYTLVSTEQSGANSTMMNMTPIVPDIVLRPKKPCPPPE